jgi:hypothetical protein
MKEQWKRRPENFWTIIHILIKEGRLEERRNAEEDV